MRAVREFYEIDARRCNEAQESASKALTGYYPMTSQSVVTKRNSRIAFEIPLDCPYNPDIQSFGQAKNGPFSISARRYDQRISWNLKQDGRHSSQKLVVVSP